MQEGPINEISYYFPALQIQSFMEHLQASETYEDQYMGPIEEKIVVMTHDDQFDREMFKIESDNGFQSTWFLLDTQMNDDIPESADTQIHLNKETGTFSEQINRFNERFGFEPIFNRNHRLLWRANNFDFPFMALNGILADSTLIGTRPFRPVINGKIMPIWELPFCITDKSDRFMASYSVAGDYETPFREGLSPIVILSHPFDVCKRYSLESCFWECLKRTQKYNYKMMSMSDFYNKFLKPQI